MRLAFRIIARKMKAREGERKEGRGGGSRMRVALERKNNGFGARLVIGELRSVLSSSVVEKIRGETRIDWKE